MSFRVLNMMGIAVLWVYKVFRCYWMSFSCFCRKCLNSDVVGDVLAHSSVEGNCVLF